MCGISCCLACTDLLANREFQQWWADVQDVLCRRGPDSQHQCEVDVQRCGTTFVDCASCRQDLQLDRSDSGMPRPQLLLSGCVLHLRGELTPQPLECSKGTGNLLLWNGEIFDGIHCSVTDNDTAVLLRTLSSAKSEEDVLSVFSHVRGPWAVVFWQAATHRLWFGRDYVGRRSLLWSLPTLFGQPFLLSSVASSSHCQHFVNAGQVWAEVPAVGLFSLDIDTYIRSRDAAIPLLLHKWSGDASNVGQSHPIVWKESGNQHLKCPVLPLNVELPTEELPVGVVLDPHRVRLSAGLESAQAEPDTFRESSARDKQTECTAAGCVSSDNRVEHLPVLTSETTAAHLHSDSPPSMPDHSVRTAIDLAKSLLQVLSEAVRVRVVTAPSATLMQEKCNTVTAPSETAQHSDQLSAYSCLAVRQTEFRPRVAVLFSGGVDSMVLAALAGQHVPADEPIDLINVAFEQEAKSSTQIVCHRQSQSWQQSQPEVNCCTDGYDVPDRQTDLAHYDVPDRQTGLAGLRELAHDRLWNFIEVNVGRSELKELRQKFISRLVQPCCSVLDDSIGCALWFAARGCGRLLTNREGTATSGSEFRLVQENYTSPAKVLLVGMGADEQLGGYSRHRQKFLHGGWHGLLEEMAMDIGRIAHRNLGRDDRCISDNGREARFPFLDESVMSFLSSLLLHQKVDLRLPRGVGEKLLLRNAAQLLGLSKAATLPKRAIQFGSRIARQESTTEKGSDVCKRLSAPTH